jgi:hypothetical protein
MNLGNYSKIRFQILQLFISWLILISGLTLRAQEYDPFYASVVSNVSYDTILTNLEHFENLGVKEPGTAALNNTANWLIEKYRSYGYTNVVCDTFEHNGKELYNIVVTRHGTSFPPRYLIIDGHYDTYQGPGVNDNGSGVACILEIARVMASIPAQYSIKFINFSAEEQGLIGSQHYVDHTVIPSNMNIVLVFNIDEVGGVAGSVNNTITCERDEDIPASNNAASYAFTDSLATITGIYSNLLTLISYAYGSDYIPFQEAGKVITGYYETNESQYVHSPNDVLSRMSPPYVYEITKAATAAALHFSHSYQLNTNTRNHIIENEFIAYPNPAHSYIEWNANLLLSDYCLRILNNQGLLVFEGFFRKDDPARLAIEKLPAGLLLMQFITEKNLRYEARIIKSL